MDDKIKLSIITINLNNAEGLEQTIQSVARQKFTSLEYIVIDGSSTDSSKQVIQQNAQSISYTISENDNGVYNAMNKGLAKANGEYVLFLNSGDVLLDNGGLRSLFNKGNNADIIYGDIIFSDQVTSRECVFPDKLTFKFFLLNSLPHSSSIVRKKLYDSMGGFFEHLRVASDWAFFLLAINKYNYSYQHVPVFVSNFRLGGLSSKELETIDKERKLILNKYFSMFLDDYKESEEAFKNLAAARKQFGYRIQNKLKKLSHCGTNEYCKNILPGAG